MPNGSKHGRSKRKVKHFNNMFYFSIFSDIKQGLNPKQISKKYGKSKQNISHYISVLKKNGLIRKIGYGTWEETSKGVIWGGHTRPRMLAKKIELWRLGYRFYIEHDNPIPILKLQILKNGGKVYKGRLMDCWLMKGKENLDIYGSVAKSDNLWSATVKAVTQVLACKNYIEDNFKLLLTPIEILRPDIIINTPETRRIAQKVNFELGRIRTDFFDVGDSSKTGMPEFEAKTIGKAQNVIDNIGITNKADAIMQKVETIENVLKGFIPQQVSVSNAIYMIALFMKDNNELLKNNNKVMVNVVKVLKEMKGYFNGKRKNRD